MIGRNRAGQKAQRMRILRSGFPLCGVQDAMEAVKKLLEIIFGDGMAGTDKKGEKGNE